MILFTLAGLAARYLLAWQPGIAVGLLAGFVVASLIPASGACSVAQRPEPSDASRDL